jgi:hypothetical protein
MRSYSSLLFFILNMSLLLIHHLMNFYAKDIAGADFLAISPILEYLSHSAVSVIISLIIIFMVALDLDERVLKQRQSSKMHIDLDADHIQLLNESQWIETHILADHDQPVWSCYSEVNESDLKILQEEFMHKCEVDESTQSAQYCDLYTHCELAVLPQLPQIQMRDQWGLFAKEDISKNKILPWVSDWGVIRLDELDDLADVARMNRRRLYRNQTFEIFQGGGIGQRSNPAIFANFFWCQTPSMTSKKSPFILYPPHFLGIPNCVYVTWESQGRMHSGLQSWRDIQAGDQILMYTGSGYALWNLHIRLFLIQGIKMIYPATFVLLVLQMYHFFSAF